MASRRVASMTPTGPCPSRPLLQSLNQGQLPWERVEELAQHVEQCAACVQAMQSLQEDDRLVALLRQEAPSQPDDPVIERLVQRLSALQKAPAGETASEAETTAPLPEENAE